jgi:hypothetical protein
MSQTPVRIKSLALEEGGHGSGISPEGCEARIVERGTRLQRNRVKVPLSRDIMIKDVQADSKCVRLLQTLGQQLELFINEGQPDLHSLFTSLMVLSCRKKITENFKGYLCAGGGKLLIRHDGKLHGLTWIFLA